MVDLNLIASFVEIVKANGISNASRRTGIPKSRLSRDLAKLEDELKIKLLRRSSRTWSLTEAGERFYEEVVDSYETLRRTSATAAEGETAVHGTLRMTAPLELGQYFCRHIIPEYLKNYPEISIDLELEQSRVDIVREGIDLAIRAGSFSESSLIGKKFCSTAIRLFASPDYLQNFPVKAENLQQHPFALMRTKARQRFYTLTLSNGQTPIVSEGISPKLITNNLTCLKIFAQRGLGVALLPDFITREEQSAGQLIDVLPGYYATEASMFFLYPERKLIPAKTKLFIDLAVEYFREFNKEGLSLPGG